MRLDPQLLQHPMQMKPDLQSTPAYRTSSTRVTVGRRLIGQSGFFTLRLLIGLLICVGACFITARTLPAFFQNDGPAKFSRRTLSFAERVAYQHAIEDVYWRHRIWPKEQAVASRAIASPRTRNVGGFPRQAVLSGKAIGVGGSSTSRRLAIRRVSDTLSPDKFRAEAIISP